MNQWTQAISGLTATQQRTVLDTLDLVANGDIKMVYGANQIDGRPCLINAIGNMVKDVNDAPVAAFGAVVYAFDMACRDYIGELAGYVTPECATFLIAAFPELRPLPQPELEELPALPADVVIPDYYVEV